MLVINDPQVVEILENTHSILQTLMSITHESAALTADDFPAHYHWQFNQKSCEVLNSPSGRVQIMRWQNNYQRTWQDIDLSYTQLRHAEYATTTMASWRRTLMRFVALIHTSSDFGAATPENVILYMDTAQGMLLMALQVIRRTQIMQMRPPAAVSTDS